MSLEALMLGVCPDFIHVDVGFKSWQAVHKLCTVWFGETEEDPRSGDENNPSPWPSWCKNPCGMAIKDQDVIDVISLLPKASRREGKAGKVRNSWDWMFEAGTSSELCCFGCFFQEGFANATWHI